MANIKSFPNNQDEYIGAEYVMKWLHGRTSGVFAAENNAGVSAVQNEMAVNVSDGLGWIANAGKDGIVWWNDHEAVNGTKMKLPIDAADSTLNRIDRIIVEWKTTNYVALPEIKVLKGAVASNAVAPALTNNSTVRQISLAQVSIPAGATAITASMVTDERLDDSVCGLVTESVKIDTSTMQNQFEALLNAIQTELQELNAGTAALLKTGDTMQGTLNMGGNKIQNVAAPENESDAVNKKFVEDSLNGKLSAELLWENARPSSSFSPQTISLELSEGDWVAITYKAATNGTVDTKEFVEVGKNVLLIGYANATSSSPVSVYTRRANTTLSGIEFEKGTSKTITDGDTFGTANDKVIPLRIHVIKGGRK